MSVRAFYHDKLPGDPTVPFDSSRPVPLETLASLKWDVFSVDGPDYEKNSQQLVQELGFTLSESSRTIFDSRGTAEAADSLTKAAIKKLLIISSDALSLNISGTQKVDIQDPVSGSWIRVEKSPGALQRIPAGSVRCLVPSDNRRIIFSKDARSDIQVVWDNDIEGHDLYREYRRRIGL
ncbi:hypothetical protein BT96DRAFT_996419 [Gymnopus androsaceus JB14]|uniref:Uncharacterized protein n=1 Tax=Gymnopus androsaceus JB14 TaxID=1447944 RepID=A0A6A4HFX6_9AGAR|nr:hypothetical protein BT96DRAFT_996419 [Gymnopus androsaceus JB14]